MDETRVTEECSDGAIPVNKPQCNKRFAQALLLLECVILIFMSQVLTYSDEAKVSDGSVPGMQFYYPVFQDVHVMIFVGFGFLMTFLHHHGWSAVGFNMMIAVLTVQMALLWNGFWHHVYESHFELIKLDVKSLITADFAAGAVLITFGALLGKVSPLQLLVIAVIETAVFGGNEMVGAKHFGAVDMGGSIFVHTFGAYFGLGAAFVLGGKAASGHSLNTASKTSDTFAMIGTLFLWMFWPSFNGALASGSQQHRVVINTTIALTGSCMSAFAFSALLRGRGSDRRGRHRFSMVDIQNATLAGGVAVGSSADLVIQPWGALLVGLVAGGVSVFGYVVLQPWLEDKIGLHDTCGVHNLHGIPGLIGGIGGAISAATAGSEAYGANIVNIFPERATRTAGEQGLYQFLALALTVAVSLVGGAVAGKVAKWVDTPSKLLFDDAAYWVVEDEDGDSTKAHVAIEMQEGEAGSSAKLLARVEELESKLRMFEVHFKGAPSPSNPNSLKLLPLGNTKTA